MCRGYTVQIIAQWQRSVALLEALIVLYQAMHAKLHQRIRMFIKTASKPIVFFHRQIEIKVIQ